MSVLKQKLTSPEIAHRVEALLEKMTLDQKIGQMTQPERMACSPEDVEKFHIGSVLSGGGSAPGGNRPPDWVSMNEAYWQASMTEGEDRVPIPLIYGIDAIHGNNNVIGATIFPHNVGLGCARDPELIRRIATATRREILASGVDWTFAPTLAVARDHHWGRTYESYSEDPARVAAYAAAFVEGMQGDGGDDSVVACAKHWVGDGGTTHGIDQGETTLPFAELDRLHIAPYRPAIDAGVFTVMASFNSWNGDKCHGHRFLLMDVLKGELGFDGFVISDWDGIDYLSKDYGEAVALSVNAGVDMFMVSVEWRAFIDHLREHVQSGTVPMDRIDDAVRRILRVKAAFGLFEKPSPAARAFSLDQRFGGAAHRALAREAVRKTQVLLKNEDEVLPLAKSARVFVAGKNADNRGHQCGGFTVAWQGETDNAGIEGGCSIWEAIRDIAPSATLAESPTGEDADPERHDVAVVVIGERPYAEGLGDVRIGDEVIVHAGSMIRGEMKVLEPYGSTLEHRVSHPEDLATIRNIVSRGIPVVTLLVSGRPLVVNEELDSSAAFVAAWLPGSEGGGVADMLFGDHEFQGTLSFSWPRSAGQVLNIDDESYDPLYPVGHGLRLNAS
ncbi:MAG: glycoside hydrolase family 3 protein [Pseudomonadota bacterium]